MPIERRLILTRRFEMSLRAGFAEYDITPTEFPVRTYFSTADSVIDPIYAHAAVFDDGRTIIAFLSLDVVIVEAEYAERIRGGIAAATPLAESNIMVCATHNHACPAVVERPGFKKDDEYLDFMVEKGIETVVGAFKSLQSVEWGFKSGFEERVSFNRRYVKRNGTVVSQPSIDLFDEDILRREGVVDPELAVLCARNAEGAVIGMLVNFACHAVHHMGNLSAGYPGVLCEKLKKLYGPECVCVFLNGACGNVIHRNYSDPEQVDVKENIGSVLANDVELLVEAADFRQNAELAAVEKIMPVKYREIRGLRENLHRLEEFNVFKSLVSKGWYEFSLRELERLHAESDHEMAVVQAFRIGDVFFGTAPCEYFAENALRVKEKRPAAKTLVVSLANGWLGYIPHKEAFERDGGHERTWAFWSKMEAAAGEMIGDAIISLVDELS